MSITVVKYYCSNPASVPLKQYSNVRYTNVNQECLPSLRMRMVDQHFPQEEKYILMLHNVLSIIPGNTPYSKY